MQAGGILHIVPTAWTRTWLTPTSSDINPCGHRSSAHRQAPPSGSHSPLSPRQMEGQVWYEFLQGKENRKESN